jgi:hypothetical protein
MNSAQAKDMNKDTRDINQGQLLEMSGGYWTACALLLKYAGGNTEGPVLF